MERKLLWVDDNEQLLGLLPSYFDSVAIHTARTPAEGLEKLAREKPGVIVTDYRIAGDMTGVQLLLEAQKRIPFSSRYIYTASGPSAREDMAERRVGFGEIDLALSLFEKPTELETIASALTAGFERYERLSAMRVMVVDDEQSVTRAVGRILKDRGYQLVMYNDSREAAAYLASPEGRDQTKPIAVLLTDMLMPNLNGADLAVQARKIDPKIGIVTFSGTQGTAANDELYRRLETEIGRFPAIAKPWKPGTLEMEIEQRIITYHLATREKATQQ